MTEEAVQATETAEDVDIDVTDEQFDKFFESGGKDGLQEETTEEEVTEETEDQAVEEPKKESLVPLAALHEERARRKELQAAQAESNARIQKMEERFQQILEKQNPAPSYDDDPIEHLKANQERLEQQIQNHNLTIEQQQQVAQQQQQRQSIISQYAAQANQFASENPDFGAAYAHLLNERRAELNAMGWKPEQITQMLENEELVLAVKSFEDEVNPAQRIYELAKLRGYKKQEETQETQGKLDQVSKGQQANRSLSGVKGQSKDELSLEALADLPDDEFDAAWAKLFK